jgi:hypothetical protein
VRFVFAIIFFVIAALAMGIGIAERTVLAGPDHVSVSATSKTAAPVVVIDGSALNLYEHTQNVQLSGSSTAFAAYGRTGDVLAWVGDTNYNEISYNAKTGKLVSHFHSGTANTVPNPAGSDMWLQQFSGGTAKDFDLKVPASMSVIAVSNGTDAAPSTVALSWPIDNSTPWTGPLILAGAAALLVGLILLLWAFLHLRRSRGPRRQQPRMPKLPRQPTYKPKRRAITADKGRRSVRRIVALVPVVGIATFALVGCVPTPNPHAAVPTSAPEAAVATKLQPTAVTMVQLREIMQRIATTVQTADSTSDKTLIATRVAGPALQDRLANYVIRKKDKKIAPSVAIPATTIEVALPQSGTNWPRSVFTVVEDKSGKTPSYAALMLVQDTPRSNYKVNYAMTLQPNTTLPDLAPTSVGAPILDIGGGLLKMKPSDLGLAYGSILDNDSASPSYSLFQADGDTFRTQVGMASHKAAAKKLPATARLNYTNSNGSGRVIALATTNSGAIVAVDLNEIETVKPVQAGAAVTAPGAILALSGKATSTKGIVATYGDQLLFYVPAASSSGKIVLLGYAQGLINAREY